MKPSAASKGASFPPPAHQSSDGAAWREIIQRYPKSPEAAEARKRLEALANVKMK